MLTHIQCLENVFKCGVRVPYKLAAENLLRRANICNSLLTRHRVEPFLHRMVTGDEKWVSYENVKKKTQWPDSHRAPLPTLADDSRPKRVLLCVWWDMLGIIHFELLDMYQTITANIYCEQLHRLRRALTIKRPAMVRRKGIILQQDNARPHTAKVTKDTLMDFSWEILPHPPYSPDLAPSDYHLFRSLERFIRGKTFDSKEDIDKFLSKFFRSKTREFYTKGIEALPTRWTKVIDNRGEYVLS